MVNQAMTKYLTIGGGVETKPTKLFIIIPGNPGLSGYYETFMSALYSRTKTPIWCVGHAGHDVVDDPPLSGNEDLFSLEGQIRHKVKFLKEHVPHGADVTLIGHSLGCKIILDVMKRCQMEDSDDGGSSYQFRGYMLFPMIERMYETPNGKGAWLQTFYLKWLMIAVSWLLNTLPHKWKKSLVQCFQSCDDPPSLNAIMDTVHPGRVRNALHLSAHELLEIKDLDVDTIEKFSDGLRFYYSPTDGWAPVAFYHNLVKSVPGIRAEMAPSDKPIPHAFVLYENDRVADIVSHWYQCDILKTNPK